jgi:D-alanine-D-alanine ligase
VGKRKRVGIVFGGRSAEHEVSLQSARSIIESIDREKYELVLIGIDKDGRWYLNRDSLRLLNADDPSAIRLSETDEPVALLANGPTNHLVSVDRGESLGTIDVLFPVLHGPYGEDGSVQGLAKLANIACVGAGIVGSAVGMDKDVMKRLLRDAGIPVGRFTTVRSKGEVDFGSISHRLGLPLFVKPANLGSSVGISRVRTEEELDSALEEAFAFDTKVLIEESISGREIECAVLGNDNPVASVPGEVVPTDGFYSYEAKYIDENGAALVIPAELPAGVREAVQELAVQTFDVLECRGLGRVDMFLTESGRLLVNEINTLPGFTKISMYPKLWEESGIPYPELIDRLIDLAIEDFRSARSLRTSYTD